MFSLFTQRVAAQSVSNEGTEFWAVFPTHIPSGNSYAQMTIFISSKSNSSGNIFVGGQKFPFSVIANTVASVNIPRSLAYIKDIDAGSVVSDKSIHILVNDGQPKVSAYAHIYARARSEAYLILPVEAHGNRYFAMDTYGAEAPNQSTESKVSGKNLVVVLATSDNTVINVKGPAGTIVPQIILPKAGDIYEITSSSLLSGSELEIENPTGSCKTFAAFSGHSGLALSGSSYDPILQQLYPVASWGTLYGIVPFKDRNFFAKVIASEDQTEVKLNDKFVTLLSKGESFETSLLTDFTLIGASKPVSVAQFTFSQDNISAAPNFGLLGDPEMVMLNPIEYSIKNITVFSSDLEAISEKYLNIFMRTKYRNTFKVNGVLPTSEWQTVSAAPEYSYLQERVYSRTLTLTADDNFNAVAYGFGDHESYAYSAGTNLATTQFLLLKNRVTNQETTAACIGQASDFILTLPYLLKRLVWKLENGEVIFDDTNPKPTQTIVNGQTIYKYLAPVNMTFNQIAQFKLAATATIAQSAQSCFTGDLELAFTVDVDPLPTADFDLAATGCADELIVFTDKSRSNSQLKQISKWLWDFGDGTTSTEQDPKHAYTTAGSFTLKLIAGAESGCLSDVVSKTITIKPKVHALFEASLVSCAGADIIFTDKSHIDVGTVVKWVWDMGDGKPSIERTTSAPFFYHYDNAGKYIISLIAHGSNGCVSAPFTKEITVYPLPTADFVLPDVCVKDGETTFFNLSKNVDGTANNLTYQWNFDDPASGAANTSTATNGKHQFTVAREYNITLTITNEKGCVKTLSKKFKINGKEPVADFEVLNVGSLCSNRSFTVKNNAYVKDSGVITKVEWYINGVKQDVDPAPQPTYEFQVPESTTDLSIKLMMIAYSGTTCFQVYERPAFTLKASPKLEFETQEPLCLNSNPVQLVVRELGNLKGKGKFSGQGVSEDGMFNPLDAGVGSSLITYAFTAENGCFQTVDQTILVYPIPQVYAGKDEYILIGGERKLQATATGNNLTYKWTPARGLDRDDVLNPIVKPDQDMTYTLTVRSGDGCTVIDQVSVFLLRDVGAPNSFTPNGDGVNDVWNVKYLDSYPKVTVEIFNRSGQRVYYSRGYTKPFDGNFNNETLPVGTYYYIINPNNGGKSITGNLTIIR